MNHTHAPVTPSQHILPAPGVHTAPVDLGLEDLDADNACDQQGTVGNAAIQDGMDATEEPDLSGLLGLAAAGVPFRSQLEDAYDTPFGDAKTATGVSELGELGADAVSIGNTMLFASPSPDKEVVGHEAAHFVQNQAAGTSVAMASGDVSDPTESSEQQADAAGKAFASGRGAALSAVSDAPAPPSASIQRTPSNLCVGPTRPTSVPTVKPGQPGSVGGPSGTDAAGKSSAVVTVVDAAANAKKASAAGRTARAIGHVGSVGYNALNQGSAPAGSPKPSSGPKRRKPGKAKGNGKRAANKRNRANARARNAKAQNNFRNNGGRRLQNARSARWTNGRAGGLMRGAGKLIAGGMNLVGAGASGIDAARNSKNTTNAGKLAEGGTNAAITGAAGLTPAGVVMAAESLLCSDPKNRNVTGLANSTASSLSGLGEAAFTGNAQALRKQTDHNRSGKNGTFVQTLTQAGELAGDAGGYVANKTGSRLLGGAVTTLGVPVAAVGGTVVGAAKAGWNLAKSGYNYLFGGKKPNR